MQQTTMAAMTPPMTTILVSAPHRISSRPRTAPGACPARLASYISEGAAVVLHVLHSSPVAQEPVVQISRTCATYGRVCHRLERRDAYSFRSLRIHHLLAFRIDSPHGFLASIGRLLPSLVSLIFSLLCPRLDHQDIRSAIFRVGAPRSIRLISSSYRRHQARKYHDHIAQVTFASHTVVCWIGQWAGAEPATEELQQRNCELLAFPFAAVRGEPHGMHIRPCSAGVGAQIRYLPTLGKVGARGHQ